MKQQKIKSLVMNDDKANELIKEESKDGWYVKQIDSFALPAGNTGERGGISSVAYIVILFEKD